MRKQRPVAVRAYWWRARPNFGDAIAPLLIERFTDYPAAWERVGKADVVSVGSVLEHVPYLYDGYILGSGRMYPDSKLELWCNTMTVLALRGPLTAKAWPRDCAIGDPGLLANELVSPQAKTVDLGIVPHLSDPDLRYRREFFSPYWTTKVINPADDPLEVIAAIGQCRKIVSSSLHGIILADAFGIPRRFEYTPTLDLEGARFKFEDYSASIGMSLTVGQTQLADYKTVGIRKHELWDSYRTINSLLRPQ